MKPEAAIFADDRPMALDDDLYQWALDAETLIRRQCAHLAAAQQEIARLRAALEGLTASYEEAGPNMDRAARNRGRLALISAREALK